jgi:hypothetical protein
MFDRPVMEGIKQVGISASPQAAIWFRFMTFVWLYFSPLKIENPKS